MKMVNIKGMEYGSPYELDNLGPCRPLHNLGIQVREIKIRKPCRCYHCHRLVPAGSIVLKFWQRCDHRYYDLFHKFCSDCYTVID